MPDYGKQVHIAAWVPVVRMHPMTGNRRRLNVLCNVTDRIITKEQADKLNRHFNRKAAISHHDRD